MKQALSTMISSTRLPRISSPVSPDGIGCGHRSATLRCAVLKLVSMRQFVLVDQSIRGLTGHHYEYAVHVLGAAAKAGYQPLLAANRKIHGTRRKKLAGFFQSMNLGFGPSRRSSSWPQLCWNGLGESGSWRAAGCAFHSSALPGWGRNDWAKYLSLRPSSFSGFVTHVLGGVVHRRDEGAAPCGTPDFAAFWGACLAALGFVGTAEAPCQAAPFSALRSGLCSRAENVRGVHQSSFALRRPQ